MSTGHLGLYATSAMVYSDNPEEQLICHNLGVKFVIPVSCVANFWDNSNLPGISSESPIITREAWATKTISRKDTLASDATVTPNSSENVHLVGPRSCVRDVPNHVRKADLRRDKAVDTEFP